MPNFVKFQRGSQEAYNRLVATNPAAGSDFYDTLYFIYDKNNPSAGGLLYLGDTLIGGTGSIVGSTTLSGLTDIDLTDIADGALLQYDLPADKWIAVQPSDIGAAGSTSVNVGILADGETVAHAQERLNASPNEGDIVIVNGSPYVYDGSAWQPLTSTDISSRVVSLETRVGTLETQMSAVDGKIATAVSNANHLTYQVVGSLDDVDDAITEASSELNRTIFLVPNSGTTGNLYDEYMIVNNEKEKLGDFSPNLSNYVTTSTFDTTVGSLDTRISGLESNLNNYVLTSTFNTTVGNLDTRITDVEDDVTTIYQMLEWHEINN